MTPRCSAHGLLQLDELFIRDTLDMCYLTGWLVKYSEGLLGALYDFYLLAVDFCEFDKRGSRTLGSCQDNVVYAFFLDKR